MVPSEDAKVFPIRDGTVMQTISGSSIAFPEYFCQGKVTLLTISCNAVAQSHATSFTLPTLSFYEKELLFQCYEVKMRREFRLLVVLVLHFIL